MPETEPAAEPKSPKTTRIPFRTKIPQPKLEYQSAFGQWLMRGESVGEGGGHEVTTQPWWKVIWLTGVDYFSTLGYQPGIALLAAGAVAPIATVILILVTLLGALPVYAQVAGRSFAGQGSIALLENLLKEWYGKLLVLVLLGFAATDFVITMTLSAADAAKHAVENPFLHGTLGDHQMLITLVILTVLAIVFLKGFSEAIGLASAAALPYLALNVIVLARCAWEISRRPVLIGNWQAAIHAKGDISLVIIGALLVFPKLALGLSGFETGVSVMPLIDGGETDKGYDPRKDGVPKGRVRNTRKLLTTAAIIMSTMLLCSSYITTLLITPYDYSTGGKAEGRALAFLAHRYLGDIFGTIYDLSTIFILGLAGASAMAGLLHLIPRYLPRFGMAPRWATLSRPLVLTFFVIDVIVTLVFRADVELQSGAYATGVLVLILSAAFAATLALWRERRYPLSLYSGLLTLVFLYTLGDNCLERPDGLIIGSIFTILLILVSGLSRSIRSFEFRITEGYFADVESWRIGPELKGKKVHLVPVRGSSPETLERKRAEIRRHYNARGPFLFLHVHLTDNRSEFQSTLDTTLRKNGDDYIAEIHGAPAIANTIAYISECIDPISIFIGLTRKDLMGQAFRYLLFGEGETGLMVYTILQRYWDWTPEDDVRPLIFLMSN
ncbi:conserved hypothetical protein [Candidatus Koribacter versatilis Ellin345]|uniref:Amino acid transporter n=1 Tax=Koribacter versatilis (strain Ellin345) TaxID=204669 RepID=Q1IJL1_KORVE|nr:hypothetical protein [Candidatus Koribacter versatilis]ABF42939.1 conserved hypothetical protein [Candidatus Koribacter versatilis Ellin345]